MLVKKQGGLPEDYHTEVLMPFMDTLVQQVNRSLQFFFSSTNYVDINHLVFAGGTAMLPGLMDKIEKELGASASIANPFVNMKIASNVDAPILLEDAPSLMVCCGLAMRSFVA